MKKAKIFYYNFPTFKNKDEKLAKIKQTKFENIPFELINPDKDANWINQTNNDFDTLLPLCSKEVKRGKSEEAVFELYSNGVNTARDEWVYDFDKNNLIDKIKFFIDKYNNLLSENNKDWENSIKWSRDLKLKFAKKQELKYSDNLIQKSNYRPFFIKKWYAEKILNDVLTKNHYDFFGLEFNIDNKQICFRCLSANKLVVLSNSSITDLNYLKMGNGITFCLPLYRYTSEGKRIDNITQWALKEFRDNYNDKKISREDIFHYVYGVLHNPAYRKKYELNLKREFPRIPFYSDFWFWSEKGKELMELHLDYEKVEKYDLQREENVLKSSSLNKAKLKADKAKNEIILDEQTTLKNIPALAWEYKLGNRSALEWILDQYKEKKPKDDTIREKFNTYKFEDYKEEVIELLQRVCTVSVKTMEIVEEMEKMEIGE